MPFTAFPFAFHSNVAVESIADTFSLTEIFNTSIIFCVFWSTSSNLIFQKSFAAYKSTLLVCMFASKLPLEDTSTFTGRTNFADKFTPSTVSETRILSF